MQAFIDPMPLDVGELQNLIRIFHKEKEIQAEKLTTTLNAYEKACKEIELLNEVIRNQQIEYKNLNEKQHLLLHALYGHKSEKKVDITAYEHLLFDEAEKAVCSSDSAKEQKPQMETIQYKRKKPGRRKKHAIAPNLPRTEIRHEDDAQKKCSCCGKDRPIIGEDSSEEIDYVPAKINVLKHIYPKFGPCKDCVDKEEHGPLVVQKPRIPRIIEGGIASESMLTHLIVSKFCDHLPFYRQEKILHRLGIDYSRETMSKQMIYISNRIQDLIQLMWDDLNAGEVVHMDETPLQVLHEPNRTAQQKSWMWVAIGHNAEQRIVLYHYHQSRGHEVAQNVLAGFKGYLQCDGFSAYNALSNKIEIKLAGCWAHARRRFFKVTLLLKEPGFAHIILGLIGKLFEIEKNQRLLNSKDKDLFIRQRKEQSQPVLTEIFSRLKEINGRLVKGCQLDEAISYTLNNEENLCRYLEHIDLQPSNNIAENMIRPFVIGRKNWLFANTPLGAHASAALYSITQTAILNDLDPLQYWNDLLHRLPVTPKENLRDLLPYRMVKLRKNLTG